MITEAERMSNIKQNKLYRKRSHNDRDDKDSHKISSLKMKKHSRSRSRSRDRAEKYYVSDYSSQCRAKLKQTYQRPKDNDDCYQQTMSVSSRMKNWKKDKIGEKGHKVIELSEPKEIDLGNIVSSTTEINENKAIGGTCVLTEAEMNKLGARIVKAELMGDNVCLQCYKRH